jgi:hypothetical protein
VSVENGEEEGFFVDAMEEYGIFHVLAPTWIIDGLPCI